VEQGAKASRFLVFFRPLNTALKSLLELFTAYLKFKEFQTAFPACAFSKGGGEGDFILRLNLQKNQRPCAEKLSKAATL